MELLIDGVRYKLWTPKDEASLEDMVKEHSKDIFGEDSIYFDIKQTIRSQAGIGSKPDGYVIALSDMQQWYIVEVELSSHPLYQHIVSQMTRFSRAIKETKTQKEIVDSIYNEIMNDKFKRTLVQEKIGSREIHEFLSHLISRVPTLVIVIEEKTKELEEVCSSLPINTEVVEFKTFEREGIGLAVHAHLFEQIWKPVSVKERITVEVREGEKPPKVTLQDLLNRGLIEANQKIFMDYKDKTFEAEILSSDEIRLLDDGTTHMSLSAAAKQIRQTETNGWIWWYTYDENGRDCMMADLREKLRQQ